MERTEQGNTMNTATYEALRKVGATEEQAIVLATAIPDIEVLRSEMERRFNQQTWTLTGVMIALVGALAALGYFT